MSTNPALDSKIIDDSAQPQTPTATLVLNVNDINVVLAALQELPHRVADPVIRNVIQQAQSQLQTTENS